MISGVCRLVKAGSASATLPSQTCHDVVLPVLAHGIAEHFLTSGLVVPKVLVALGAEVAALPPRLVRAVDGSVRAVLVALATLSPTLGLAAWSNDLGVIGEDDRIGPVAPIGRKRLTRAVAPEDGTGSLPLALALKTTSLALGAGPFRSILHASSIAQGLENDNPRPDGDDVVEMKGHIGVHPNAAVRSGRTQRLVSGRAVDADVAGRVVNYLEERSLDRVSIYATRDLGARNKTGLDSPRCIRDKPGGIFDLSGDIVLASGSLVALCPDSDGVGIDGLVAGETELLLVKLEGFSVDDQLVSELVGLHATFF